MGSLKTALASLAATLALSGCMTAPHKAYTVEQPQAAPVRNLTSMDLALSCLDRQLRDHNIPHKRLTSTGIPNRAGDKVSMGSGTDMLKTSIGQLSLSKAYTYQDLSSLAGSPGVMNGEPVFRPLDANAVLNWAVFLQNNHQKFNFPDYIVTGSISQADNNVTSDQVSGGIDAGGGGNAQGGLGGSMNQGVTVVTVDMHVEEIPSLEVISGLTTKNSIAVVRSSAGVDLSGRVSALGAHFNVNLDRTEGMHQAIRILIQLGTVELLGRLAGVPYEQCLTGETVQAHALGKAQDSFEGMSEDERVRFAQQKLATLADPNNPNRLPYYPGPANGSADAATLDAIARYQRDAGLIASGRVDLDLYRSLQNRVADVPAKPVPQVPPPPVAVQAIQQPPRLSLEAAPGSTFKPGSTLAVSLTVDQDAHVQCFLRTDSQEILRIFPTADQPDDLLRPGQTLTAPKPSASRQIELDKPGTEEIGCVVSAEAFKVGAALPKGPLGTASLPLPSLQAVHQHYQSEAGGAAVGFERLAVRVK